MISLIESMLLVIALSLDAFFSSFAYGTNKIKISISVAIAINILCTFFLAIAIFLGFFLNTFINSKIVYIISFLIFLIIGIIKLMDSIIKNIIRKYKKDKIQLNFSLFSLNFVLSVYANPEKADIDKSKDLSVREAIILAIALSIDGIVAGIGIGLNSFKHIQIILLSFILGLIAVLLGCFLGNKLSKKNQIDLSWISGLILMILAITKL